MQLDQWTDRQIRPNVGRNQRPNPKYSKGDKAGKFLIIRYMGWSRENPDTGKRMHKSYHWYEARCSCNMTEILHEDNLRKRTQCLLCTKLLRKKKKPAVQSSSPEIPNFATMKW